jgi:beta-lactamase regulating signal transducer with metallopeptidase domain
MILATIVDAGARATLLLGGALLATRVLRSRPACYRHLVWCLAVAGTLALPLLQILMPAWRVHVLPPVETSAAAVVLDDASSPTPLGSNWPTWDEWVLLLWLAGVCIVLGRLLIARATVRSLALKATPVTDWRRDVLERQVAERAIHREVVLLESAEVDLPMTWGFREPVVALPLESTGWSRARFDAALAHELAHVRRLDALTQHVAQVACALYWFHPLAWVAALQMRRLREFACDDEVLANGAKPSHYAQELLAIVRTLEEKKHMGSMTAGMANTGQLKARLFAVLNPGMRRSRVDRTRVVALAGGTAGVVVALAIVCPVSAAETTVAPPTVCHCNLGPRHRARELATTPMLGAAAETEGTCAAGDPLVPRTATQ